VGTCISLIEGVRRYAACWTGRDGKTRYVPFDGAFWRASDQYSRANSNPFIARALQRARSASQSRAHRGRIVPVSRFRIRSDPHSRPVAARETPPSPPHPPAATMRMLRKAIPDPAPVGKKLARTSGTHRTLQHRIKSGQSETNRASFIASVFTIGRGDRSGVQMIAARYNRRRTIAWWRHVVATEASCRAAPPSPTKMREAGLGTQFARAPCSSQLCRCGSSDHSSTWRRLLDSQGADQRQPAKRIDAATKSGGYSGHEPGREAFSNPLLLPGLANVVCVIERRHTRNSRESPSPD